MNQLLHTAINVLRESAFNLLSILLFIVAGVIIGEVLKLTSWSKIFLKFSNRAGIWGIILASLIGMASPICTFGTVPVCIQLYRSGSKLPPLITFLSASSLMNPQMFIWTWGLIGPKMALLRILTVFIVSVALGLLSGLVKSEKLVANRVSEGIDDVHASEHETQKEIMCRPNIKTTTVWQFAKNAWGSLEYILFYLLIGIILSVLLKTFVPADFVQEVIASDKWYTVLVAALLGVPLYQCGGVAIPIINGLIQSGMGYGAALTFFLVGPATNFSPIFAFATIIKPKFVALYLAVLITFAILIGYLFGPISKLLT
ncbi:MAG: permease [Bacillota bacterium]